MALSNLLVPNSYDLFCGSITTSDPLARTKSETTATIGPLPATAPYTTVQPTNFISRKPGGDRGCLVNVVTSVRFNSTGPSDLLAYTLFRETRIEGVDQTPVDLSGGAGGLGIIEASGNVSFTFVDADLSGDPADEVSYVLSVRNLDGIGGSSNGEWNAENLLSVISCFELPV